MPETLLQDDTAFRAAFLAHEQQERINTGKVAAALVFFLMPLGLILDHYYTYLGHHSELLKYFLFLRLGCSALAAVIWYLFHRAFGRKHYRALGLPIAWLPAASICWMIALSEGAASPYYAGLNLIVLAVSAVVHWSTWESLLAVAGIVAMYGLACIRCQQPFNLWIFINNVYFLIVTGIIVVVGNHVFNRLRQREFALRYELDRNRQQLQESHQKLVELDQVKSRFFANISHELRTPLTLLLAPLESLIQRSDWAIDGATKELLQTMRSNGMRLLKLINDLLDLVRLESGRMTVKREPTDMAAFVNGLANAARHVAQDKRIRLETRIDPELGTVSADRDKLEKVLLNLIFNALKFTPAGGRVEVRAEKQDDAFVLAVADTGMGIAEKQLPYVFDRFWQADTSAQRKFQGAGIGLALVKELVELQGGNVVVESQEEKGTTFTIRLPFVPAEAAPETETAALAEAAMPSVNGSGSTPSEEWLSNLYRRAELFPAMTPVQESLRPVESWTSANRARVVVADDEPEMLRFLKSQLASQYQVLEAVDGQQAIDKASQFLPDLVLLDMMMPEKDGIQACRELRERTSTQSIPIIMVTARADDETKMAALKAGASDFLTKPFSSTELHVRIRNLIESYEYQRKLAKQNQILEQTIEQLKETESQLVQSEKMASLGRLSAGIIHEINNPLNFATTGLFSLRNKGKLLAEEQRTEYTEILKDVEEGIGRVKDIVSGLRTFSYAENANLEAVEVSGVLSTALRLSSHEWKDKVHIHQQLQPDQTIWANRNRLIQVVLNLLQNSLDALAQKTFDAEEPGIWMEGRTEGDRTYLVMRDNGVGIDPKNLDKIFDPFFTTKDVGEGMGLGLSICYRIIQEFEGRIHVKSELGKFCEFTLEFPLKKPQEHDKTATE